jgi:hypothetical protein
MDKIYIFDIIDIIFSGGRSGGTYSIPRPARLNRYNNRKRDKRAEQRYTHSLLSLYISHHYVNMYANICVQNLLFDTLHLSLATAVLLIYFLSVG